MEDAKPFESGENCYTKYIEPFLPEVELPRTQPKIRYTIHLHRAVYTDEIFSLYQKYEKAVHKRDVEPSDLKTHLCNSPVYDEYFEESSIGAEWPPTDNSKLDEGFGRVHEELGTRLELKGSYHFYHRLDGKLVAFGNLDFLD